MALRGLFADGLAGRLHAPQEPLVEAREVLPERAA
jgi:hypothetical protein